MSELPWLDDLVRLANFCGDDTDGVFERDFVYWSVEESRDESEGCELFGLFF